MLYGVLHDKINSYLDTDIPLSNYYYNEEYKSCPS